MKAVPGSVNGKLNTTPSHTFLSPQHLGKFSLVLCFLTSHMRQRFIHLFNRKGKIEMALLIIIIKIASKNLKNAGKLLLSGFKISHWYSLMTKKINLSKFGLQLPYFSVS